jgi:AcrR family transcriptional regulator
MTQKIGDLPAQTDLESKADDTRERILYAAAQVFSEKGYARATTRALAAAADVNEVTLFRHFGSKQNLFAAVIERFAGPAITKSLEAQWTGDYRADLLIMGRQVMELLLERQDSLRLMLCEAEHFPEVRAQMAQNPRQLRHLLARYLQQQMDQGLLRRLNPEVAAQAFWGMFFAYAIALGVFAEPATPELSTDQVVEHFVDIFVKGTIGEHHSSE